MRSFRRGHSVSGPGGLHRRRNRAAVRIDPALESLIPADTVFIVGSATSTRSANPGLSEAAEPRARCRSWTSSRGKPELDPRKDLSQVLSCSNGKTAVLMARGKFNVADLEARLQARGAARSSYKNHDLFGNGRLRFFS